ncbi:hypothetical protein K438DRAFT_1767031 [Mycena galopus ATCC 62051]|nr:hypothetical protein K438DRAFT_1767031 [Mycena galopus ATCC 62051]
MEPLLGIQIEYNNNSSIQIAHTPPTPGTRGRVPSALAPWPSRSSGQMTGRSWYSLLVATNAAQTWKHETGQISSLSTPDACNDLTNSVSTAGNQLQVWSCTGIFDKNFSRVYKADSRTAGNTNQN